MNTNMQAIYKPLVPILLCISVFMAIAIVSIVKR